MMSPSGETSMTLRFNFAIDKLISATYDFQFLLRLDSEEVSVGRSVHFKGQYLIMFSARPKAASIVPTAFCPSASVATALYLN